MGKLEDLYCQLEKYKNFEEGDNDEKFLETLDKLVFLGEGSSIKVILKYFDDEDRGWVLESVNSSLEHYNQEIYVKELLQNINIMLPQALVWAVGMLYGILNNKECFNIMKQNIQLAQKEPLLQLLDKIYEESEMHRPIIDELKKLLNDKNK